VRPSSVPPRRSQGSRRNSRRPGWGHLVPHRSDPFDREIGRGRATQCRTGNTAGWETVGRPWHWRGLGIVAASGLPHRSTEDQTDATRAGGGTSRRVGRGTGRDWMDAGVGPAWSDRVGPGVGRGKLVFPQKKFGGMSHSSPRFDFFKRRLQMEDDPSVDARMTSGQVRLDRFGR